jgi:MmoB/DmpM family
VSQPSVYQDNKRHVSLELMKGEVADAVLEAIEQGHEGVKVTDMHGFIIIEVLGRMRISAQSVRDHLGKSEWVMTDLNEVMAAFSGNIETYTTQELVLSRPKA